MTYWINEIPNHFKTREMCIEAAETNPWQLEYFPGHLLNYVPVQFVTQEQVKLWHDYDDDCNYNELIKWY